MTLNHITQRPRLIIKTGTAAHSDILRMQNLYVINIISIPERLQKQIGKTENQYILNGAFSQLMMGPIYLVFP